MKKVQFSTICEDQVDVTVDGDNYGILVFDHEQNAWVLWIRYIDDGISLWNDLAETQKTIIDELI